MTDKNNRTMKTGDVVEITGAYFKNDNGLYFVEHTPGDPNWSGRDHCLRRIKRNGELSTAKDNLCFWPISAFVNSRDKRAAANEWNREHAEIEIKAFPHTEHIAAYFASEADSLDVRQSSAIHGTLARTARPSRTRKKHKPFTAPLLTVSGLNSPPPPPHSPAQPPPNSPNSSPPPPAQARKHPQNSRRPPPQNRQNSPPRKIGLKRSRLMVPSTRKPPGTPTIAST